MSKPRLQPLKTESPGKPVRAWGLAALAVGVVAVAVAFAFQPAKPSASSGAAASEKSFQPTVENTMRPPSPAPEGMVWIPGGEFSMGSDETGESLCGLPGVTRDAQPVHRVYVDGFWMDATEV